MSFILNNLLGIIIACTVIFLYIKIKKKLKFFEDKGMVYEKPSLGFLLRSLKPTEQFQLPVDLYNKYKDESSPYMGVFLSFLTPSVVVTDPALIERILIKDFSHFQDHGFDIDYESNPLFAHLFALSGDTWRTLRHKLVPTFTSGKIKGMIPTMNNCANELVQDMKDDRALREEANLKDIFRRYTLDVIAICAFGIDPESIKDPDCEIRKVFKDMLNPPTIRLMKVGFALNFPKISKFFKIKIFPKYIEEFFLKLTRDAFEIRKKSGMYRNDFIQLLYELKEKGSIKLDTKDLDDDEKKEMKEILAADNNADTLELTDELLSAQVFIFLFAGFENTAYVSAITTYMISKHPEIQKRLREELRAVKDKYPVLDYMALKEMKLLGACIDESLRLYSAIPALMRKCNKAYTLSDGIKIEKGLGFLLPITGLHTDSNYWPNPNEFNPDRFLNGDSIKPGTYLPFGDGPRICIAQRLALIIVKVILYKIFLDFEVRANPKTKEPMKINARTGADMEGGIWGDFYLVQET